jgi:cytochrome c oxidase subunit 1
VSSPPPVFNFESVPTVVGGPYEYGVPGAVHAVFKEEEEEAREKARTSAGAVPAPAGGGGAPPSSDP